MITIREFIVRTWVSGKEQTTNNQCISCSIKNKNRFYTAVNTNMPFHQDKLSNGHYQPNKFIIPHAVTANQIYNFFLSKQY